MSRKHYVAIARVIAEQKAHHVADATALIVLEDVASMLAQEFGDENDLFDQPRFMAACGF